MSLLDKIKKPEYYLQPKRLLGRFASPKVNVYLETTPWKEQIEVDPNEVIGQSINHFGIYDLAVTEILFRLAESGSFVLDIGANIGYTTNVLSNRVGAEGKVWSFEPNPRLLPRLKKNISLLKNSNVTLFPIALSSSSGQGFLTFPAIYEKNEGVAYISDEVNNNSIKVNLEMLDSIIPADSLINVLKIDVEGHEFAVFQGAKNLLTNKVIKNIIFEDDKEYPSDVVKLLTSFGYTIFRIERDWLNVKLKNPSLQSKIAYWEATNYLATLEPDKVKEKFKGTFYTCI